MLGVLSPSHINVVKFVNTFLNWMQSNKQFVAHFLLRHQPNKMHLIVIPLFLTACISKYTAFTILD